MRNWSPTVLSVHRAFASPLRFSSLYILTVLYLIRTFSGMSEHIHMVKTSIHTCVLPFFLGVLSLLSSPLRQLHCSFHVRYTNMILLICVKSRDYVWEKAQHGTEPDLIPLISSCICFLHMTMLSLRLRKPQCSSPSPQADTWHLWPQSPFQERWKWWRAWAFNVSLLRSGKAFALEFPWSLLDFSMIVTGCSKPWTLGPFSEQVVLEQDGMRWGLTRGKLIGSKHLTK